MIIIVGEKTERLMGVNEMLLSTSLCGVLFALLSAQPLIIIGSTGPVLVFEEAVYKVGSLRTAICCILCYL